MVLVCVCALSQLSVIFTGPCFLPEAGINVKAINGRRWFPTLLSYEQIIILPNPVSETRSSTAKENKLIKIN